MRDVAWFLSEKSHFSGLLLFGEPLSKHTYYRIGGPARILAVPKSLEDLNWLADGIHETGIPFYFFGAGSNLLVSDEGFPGLAIRTQKMNLEILTRPCSGLEPLHVLTGASVMISSLLRRAAQEGWGGLEFLTGIPGTVGGAIRMNAGTHLGETQNRVRKVESFSLERMPLKLRSYEGAELKFRYRKNLFLEPLDLVWNAEWEVVRQEPAQVKSLIDETLARRKATQPLDYPSCGSVFKNPKESGLSAWQVVNRLGLRGHKIGDAQISEKHSNFILNLGSAKAQDVFDLIQLAKTRARDELGIELEEEVVYLGSNSEPK